MDSAPVLAALAVALPLVSAAVSVVASQRSQALHRLAMPLLGISRLLALAAGMPARIDGGAVTATLPLGLPWLPRRARQPPVPPRTDQPPSEPSSHWAR